MSNFVQFLQVNQHFKKLSYNGSIAPLAFAKVWFGEPNHDPKKYPKEVFVTDVDGNQQILSQPLYTDALGNYVIALDGSSDPVFPQINGETYSVIAEVEVEGQIVTYHRALVSGGIDDSKKFQRKDELIDLTTATISQDLKTNAPTAESVINKIAFDLNDVVRRTALSDAIDSSETLVAANSKAVSDLNTYLNGKISANETRIDDATADLTLKIDKNTEDITTNQQSIGTNTANINTNKILSQENSGQISNLSSRVNTIDQQISVLNAFKGNCIALYAGRVRADGQPIWLPSGWSSRRWGKGYRITTTLGVNPNVALHVTSNMAQTAGPGSSAMWIHDTNSFDCMFTWSSGSVAIDDFSFLVIRL